MLLLFFLVLPALIGFTAGLCVGLGVRFVRPPVDADHRSIAGWDRARQSLSRRSLL